ARGGVARDDQRVRGLAGGSHHGAVQGAALRLERRGGPRRRGGGGRLHDVGGVEAVRGALGGLERRVVARAALVLRREGEDERRRVGGARRGGERRRTDRRVAQVQRGGLAVDVDPGAVALVDVGRVVVAAAGPQERGPAHLAGGVPEARAALGGAHEVPARVEVQVQAAHRG